MTRNMGQLDRMLRAGLGVVLLALAFTALTGGLAWGAAIVGVVLIVTSALGFCPPYSLLGINTCKTP